jgi:serine protease Do
VKNGVFVVNVAPGSPAMQAGLQSTDVIIRVGRFEIDNPGEIARMMSAPGINTIKLHIIRKKKPQTVTLRW